MIAPLSRRASTLIPSNPASVSMARISPTGAAPAIHPVSASTFSATSFGIAWGFGPGVRHCWPGCHASVLGRSGVPQGTTRTSAAVTGGTYTVAVFPDVAWMYGAPRLQTPSVVTNEPASVTCPAPADSEPAGVPCR